MVIELYVDELVNQMRAVSHKEVDGIADAEARYRAEAGTEKLDELYHCLNDAAARLGNRCARFLRESYVQKKDNIHNVPELYHYEFVLSERRAINKADGLLSAMNNFVLEYALSKFYSIVSQGDLSNKHSLLAVDEGNTIDQLLYVKQPPRV